MDAAAQSELLTYWTAQLAGAPDHLALPTDRARSSQPSYRGAALPLTIPPAVAAGIQAVAERAGATSFMTLAAAFNVLLARHSGQSDICIGMPGAAGSIVLRTRVAAGMPFTALLEQVRATTQAAQAHGALPLEALIERLRPHGGALFHAMLVPGQDAPVPVPATCDVVLRVTADDGRLDAAFEYNADLFDAATAARMAARFVRLLQGIAADPACRVGDLPMLGDDERDQLLRGWNDTASAYPATATIHQLFEARAAATPDAVAVVCAGEHLTYRELNLRANRLARHLRARGAGPDVLVALCVDRTFDMFVCLMGILKAGAAYVPMDPAYPPERLRHMLDEARPALLLTQSHLLPALPASDVPLCCIDAQQGALAALPDTDPDYPVAPHHLAYVIYTSGSTGRPKGVAIYHSAVVNLLHAMRDAPGIDARDVFLGVASLSFDMATPELYLPLAFGARTVLVSREVAGDPVQLCAVVERQQVTIMQATPSTWRMLLAHAWPANSRHIKLLCGAEALPVNLLAELLQRTPVVWNLYGPTETTVWSTVRRIASADAVPSIGRPLANTQVYLLDDGLQPVPVGVAGELYIAGDGVARGYLNRPDLTAERFLPDPFGGTPGARMYRTGDLARYLADGNIEYLGRADHQVKVRGFRIELAEIESALALAPGVRDCVVLAREDVPGDQRLVAYVVPRAGEAFAADGLRAALARALPDYMVPAHFVVLDRIPLTPNGKTDRKALPAPDMTRGDVGYVAPRTPGETAIAAIWCDVLGLDRVGVDDNFFALGGHSLLATQVVSRVRSAFEVDLPLRALFEAPTVAGLARRFDAASGTTLPALRPAPRDGAPALSFAQARLWFLDQFESGTALYNMPSALRLTGTLDVSALSRALQGVVDRHEGLRTTFAVVGDQPVQVIAPALALPLPVIDLAALPHAEREARALWLAQDDAQTPFDLATGPLIRTRLLRLAADEHILLVTLHHIVSDGWSMGVLVREIGALYGGSSLPPLPVQYADFAYWQRQWLSGDVLDTQLAYWKARLDGAPALLALPTDRPRPPLQSYRGALLPFAIPDDVAAGLYTVSQRAHATLFMTLAAAFDVLLARYSGQSDICLGTPVASRSVAETQDLIGFFVNTLVLRAQVDNDISFTALLDQVRANALEAYSHQDLPFERLVEAVQPERSLDHAPLFQVMLAFQETIATKLHLPGLVAAQLDVGSATAKYDLTLHVVEEAGGIQATFEYNTDLFDTATIERMAAHLTRLLAAIAADPACRIADLPMLADAERSLLLHGWNDTATAYPAAEPIHRLFEARAAAIPDAIAVVCGDEQLSYGELNARANQLAHRLRALGVGPDVTVGLCVDRSPAMLVGLLGTMKAGGAYIPLDPAYPAERLAYMLDDARPAVLLTQTHLLSELSAGSVVCLDDPALATLPTANPPARSLPGHLAYVIYTSGSTGRPKGVGVPHGALANLIHAMRHEPGLASDDVLLAVTSLSFDIAALELFLPLAFGARVVLADRAAAANPQQLAALIHVHGVTTMQATPSTWRMLLAHGWPDNGRPLKILCGGEALPASLLAELLAHVPVVWNMYGPTETTIWSMVRGIAAGDTASIGRPIANTQIYLLDDSLQPVPVGVPGELYIAGDGVARGYLNRPDLTAERFLPNPFSAVPGARMYRTGDLARYLADGNIDYLGRADHQVKVRGFRIELAEIESALSLVPGVRDSVVLAREDVPGDTRLVAYVVPREDETVSTDELRAALARSLPDYMVPAHFVVLDRMPLTPNGKIDRKALPAPDMTRGESGYVAPRTPGEIAVAKIWCDVLGLDRVGVDDNFFGLGGHSLLATQVVSRLRSAFDVDLPLRALFEAPTVAGFAQRFDAATGTTLPPLRPVARDSAPALSFAQARLWFLDQFESGTALYNMPSALRLTGTLDVDALARALQAVVDRHEILRTTFAVAGDQPVQIIAPALTLPLPVIDLSELPHAEREARALWLAQDEAQTPFDLATGPLIRARLLRLAADEHILLVTLHHIISDGWSMGVLVREIGALYAGSAPLPPLPVQYADFAHWQRQWLSGDVLDTQLAYWKARLDGAPSLLALPTDRPRPPLQSYRGALLPFAIPADVAAGLYTVSQRAHATLFMTLAAAFDVLLARYSGQSDICLGTPVANRSVAETQDLIGLFVNTLVLRAQVDNDVPFTALLEQVRTTALEAYSHQDLPFERLVEAVQPERSLNHAPLFQVMLALQTSTGGPDVPGLAMTQIDTGSATAKYDLTLYVDETDGRLQATFEYNTDLFDATTLERMAGHFTRLLAAIAADPACRVADLPLLADAERDQLLHGWNNTAAAYPAAEPVHRLFEARAEATPDAIAVVCGDEQLSYGELNARANQLAHRLHALGVGPDVTVGLCVDRSPAMLVGLLGTMKAGGAYIPLDPAYPAERLAYMLDDARPAVLLTQTHLLSGLSAGSVVCLDEPALGALPASNPPARSLPGHLAYVIYTSGSTGRPKGVGVPHGALANLIHAMRHEPGLASDDVLLAVTSLSFDIAALELFLPLAFGARLVLADRAAAANPQQLAALIDAHNVTTMQATPSTWRMLLAHGWPDTGRPLKILCGGEALPASLLAELLTHVPVVWNMYGPTETTIWSMVRGIATGDTASIGRPIANTQIYLLDDSLQPVPIGVAGELYIAGDGVARGYLNRPDLTAERFLPNPFSDVPGARMYRTGDLARYLADGNIDYLGRADHQVKVRGFRIELAEIESALSLLACVRDSVVLAREDVPGDTRLVAYVVPREGETAAADDLRAALARTLPDYMVPAHFVVLDRMPLTPNGKTDRKALPAPDMTRGESGYVAPRTPGEIAVAKIWCDVLGLDRVGIDDNFFGLGGHSLLATQVVSRLRSAFDVDLPLRALFEAPTVAGFAQRFDAASGTTLPALRPVPRDGAPALSFAQARLWFLDQFESGTALYNMPSALRLTGTLDVSALARALQGVVDRHEVLRTTFAVADDHPVQIIAPALPLPLPVIDLAELPHAEREARALWLAQDEAQTPFDLATGPLIRTRLLRLAADEHILLVTLHHIVSDGWSMGVLVREIGALYAGSSPPPLPVQYADFAHWQRQWLSGDVLDTQLAYWKARLDGAPALLALPTDRPRPPLQSYRGALLPFAIPADVAAGLYAVSQRAHATLFMTLAAAFDVLLARYSGQSDICLGTPVANRSVAETQDLIGLFVNTLVLRAQVDNDVPFTALLDQVRATALEAYSHQDLPFERLVEALQAERSLNHAPLFQVMLALQTSTGGPDVPGLAMTQIDTGSATATAKYDLTLYVDETDGRLQATFEYNTDLFDTTTIERMAAHLTRLLAAIAADPACRVADLPMLADAERDQLLHGWNQTATAYPAAEPIHRLFEAQAAAKPDAIAVVCGDERLSYGELNIRANQLAHRLRALGVGPDVTVGLCVDRSPAMLVGLLGTMKAGGAYIPLDPAYPAERLAYMLDDARPAVLLTQTHLLSELSAGSVVCLDDPALAALPASNPAADVQSGNLAYVIYTSGSTGRPKGVGVPHGALANLIHAMRHEPGLVPDDVLLAVTSLSFDIAALELFLPVAFGARLVLADRAAAANPQQLAALIDAHNVTTMQATPSTWRMLLAHGWPDTGRPLKILCGGEALPASLLAELLAHVPIVWNMYGPTETTIWSMVRGIAMGEAASIGRPIANTQIYLLDDSLQPVPIGVAGELYIAGDGVARGYLNRPDLTAERFLPNPFGGTAGGRMYRTGDLARYLPDGNIDYLGRADHQVKVRGFRIELAEIESALSLLPGVRDSVVLAREDVPGDTRLVAYVVPRGGETVTADDLRAALARTLPDYMVPAHVVVLDRMPLTPNGKTDRKSLPAPDMTRGESGYVAPRTPSETAIAEIWCEVLGLDRVGVQDNFFALGGHSLLATKVIACLRGAFDVDLPLRAFFETPTVEGLADRVEAIILEEIAALTDEEVDQINDGDLL